jgi:hypothetical protein
MNKRLLALSLCAALLNAGCFEFLNTSLTKPDSSVGILGGRWVSASSDANTLLNSCTNFVWNVTEKTATSGKGNFSATCFNVIQVTGTAQGTMTGSTITWSASGVSTGGPTGTCPISLSGTATMTATDIQIPFSGSTCLGPVSGTEILKKQ